MHDLLTNMKQIRGALVLYQAIEDIITSYVDAKISIVQSKQNDQDLIETYAREWQHFLCGSRFADHVLQFMNRHWIRREVDENKKGVFFIFHLCMKIWREAVFSSPEGVGERLSHSIVTLVRRDREGQTVDTSAIKTTLDSIQRLDLRIYGAGSVDVTPAQDFNAIVKSIDRFDLVSFGEPYGHKASLEIELIKDTESFYRDKANVAVSDMKVQDYIKSVSQKSMCGCGKKIRGKLIIANADRALDCERVGQTMVLYLQGHSQPSEGMLWPGSLAGPIGRSCPEMSRRPFRRRYRRRRS